MNSNPNGKLAVYANANGVYYGKKLVDELNIIIRKENNRRMKDGSRDLEEEITLKVPKVTEFPNSMFKSSLEEGVRGEDALLVQWFPRLPSSKPEYRSSWHKDEFFMTISALLQAGVKRLSLFTPYAYDQRKDTREGRDTIGAALFCQQLSGVTHGQRMQAFCLDIHAQPIIGYYQLINIDMVSIPMFKTYVDFIKNNYPEVFENSVMISPDSGASKRGRAFSELTGLPNIIVDKVRVSPTETRIEHFFPPEVIDVKGKTGVLVDDILASGTTADGAISHMKSLGILDTYWLITHPELTNLGRLDDMHKRGLFKKIFIADTIEPPRDYLVEVPTAKLAARLIYNVHTDQSISPFL